MLSNEAIENIRNALETKVGIAFLDETRFKFKQTLDEFNEFICDIEDEINEERN